ncbi:hypothetical protein C3941_11265 [Kaistia algarum]|uniref:phosphatase PAP2 family protein n=1 Tax=Kaistia algarum TaxID=2083279 RepID=UPI000CE8CE9B|nr:phosphatase PAP2 family protein [Kaistia algarum]PPE79673.1 hypothetical protein C3941_11265 [Kaistia algarum]
MTAGFVKAARATRRRYQRNIASIVERARRVEARMPRRSGLTWGEIIAVTLFLCALVVGTGFAFDAVSVERARALPGIVTFFFGIISDMGKSQWELYPSGIVVLVLLAGSWHIVPPTVRVFWTEFGALTAFLFGSIAGIGILVNIVKQLIGRGRPVTFDYVGPFMLDPFRFAFEFQSFPSGHSATAGALIAFGFLVARRWKLGLLIFGLAIGASRVVVAAHYPSDVLAGLLVGYIFSIWLAHRCARYGWAFSLGSSGTIRARAACIRWAWSRPERAAMVLAGLADALCGRRVWLPLLKPIGVVPNAHSRSDGEPDRLG